MRDRVKPAISEWYGKPAEKCMARKTAVQYMVWEANRELHGTVRLLMLVPRSRVLCSPVCRSLLRCLAPGCCGETDSSPADIFVHESSRVGNGSGQSCRFQLASSWKRQLCPDRLVFPTRLEQETKMFACGLPVSSRDRVGNGRFAQTRTSFQHNGRW
jgi:hypothetical protein